MPLYGVRLVLDRAVPNGWLVPPRPTIDAPMIDVGRFVDEWKAINGR